VDQIAAQLIASVQALTEAVKAQDAEVKELAVGSKGFGDYSGRSPAAGGRVIWSARSGPG
jgi:hypothetical protein